MLPWVVWLQQIFNTINVKLVDAEDVARLGMITWTWNVLLPIKSAHA